MNYETRLNNRVDLGFPTWFETDRSQQNVVKFTLLSHWCYVKGAVINKVGKEPLEKKVGKSRRLLSRSKCKNLKMQKSPTFGI